MYSMLGTEGCSNLINDLVSSLPLNKSYTTVENTNTTHIDGPLQDVYVSALRLIHTKLKLQPTGFRLASDSKIGVNGTMLYQCNPTASY